MKPLEGADFFLKGSPIAAAAAGDRAGSSVAFNSDGTVFAIGAGGHDGFLELDTGHVRVFAFNGESGFWSQLGSEISGVGLNDRAGETGDRPLALSSDGRMVAIGTPGRDFGFLSSIFNVGHVRVFVYDEGGNSWSQRGQDIAGDAASDNAGWSVALSGDGSILAVGIVLHDGNGGNSGLARIFAFNEGNQLWEQMGQDIGGEAAADRFGYSVSLSSDGGIVAAGAPFNDGAGDGAGSVRAYAYDEAESLWTQLGFDIDGEAAGDESGHSLSLSSDGGVLAIGAPFNAESGTAAGHARVYIFDEIGNSWLQRGQDIDGEAPNDRSGLSVSLSSDGGTLAIGAPDNDGNGDSSGHTRVYSYDPSVGSWTQKGSDLDGAEAGAEAGFRVALSGSGNVVGAGSAKFDSGTGRASAYELLFTTEDVTGDPSSFDLFTATEVATARTLGQSDVTSSPDTFDLFTATEVATARTLGQSDVTSSPDTFDLFTQSEVSSAADAARTIVNVSVRVALGIDEIVIPGFVVIGQSKKVLIRAVGPKLIDLSVPVPLADPQMRIFRSGFDGGLPDVIASVDDWKEDGADVDAINAAISSAGAFPLEPAAEFQGRPFPTDDTKSAATLMTLDAGVYTIIVSSVDESEGEVLVEVYEIVE